MRVAVIATGLEHVKRGVESWAVSNARLLRDAGIDAILLKGSGTCKEGLELSVPCCRRGSRMNGFLLGLFSRLGGWRYGMGNPYEIEQVTFFIGLVCARLALLKTFDIIDLQEPVLARLLQWLGKIRIIKARTVLGYGTGEKYTFLRSFTNLRVFAPYHADLLKAEGRGDRKTYVVPHSVDTDVFKPGVRGTLRRELGLPEDAFVVLSAAAIKKFHKRADWLVRELRAFTLRDPGLSARVFLVLAGARDDETADIADLARQLSLSDRVKFMADVDFERMPDVYRMADLFVLGSLYEMFGIVLIEAGSSALPVVTHDFPVFRWIVGDAGECIDMAKEGVLAGTIGKYLDPAYRDAKARNARDNVVKRFSKDVVAGQVLAMYRDILQERIS